MLSAEKTVRSSVKTKINTYVLECYLYGTEVYIDIVNSVNIELFQGVVLAWYQVLRQVNSRQIVAAFTCVMEFHANQTVEITCNVLAWSTVSDSFVYFQF